MPTVNLGPCACCGGPPCTPQCRFTADSHPAAVCVSLLFPDGSAFPNYTSMFWEGAVSSPRSWGYGAPEGGGDLLVSCTDGAEGSTVSFELTRGVFLGTFKTDYGDGFITILSCSPFSAVGRVYSEDGLSFCDFSIAEGAC